ncbi:hypothetical protein MPNT_340002 [Candidatus Methylacidithermus pantelleriae]|uniref:Uncharacterized protein n=1 Tax=Candidatus Methylacidithermus pantelleriae TaxID=2744239 RepID=A0A8J2FT21_9BACT|nr:hypothetical protein MPNT_340002 [Candidatus Methylacidithermus pantelleriae]
MRSSSASTGSDQMSFRFATFRKTLLPVSVSCTVFTASNGSEILLHHVFDISHSPRARFHNEESTVQIHTGSCALMNTRCQKSKNKADPQDPSTLPHYNHSQSEKLPRFHIPATPVIERRILSNGPRFFHWGVTFLYAWVGSHGVTLPKR